MNAEYPPAIKELVADKRLPVLGPGKPNVRVRDQLANLTAENAFAGKTIHDIDMAAACLAGLWLYHDFLAESHALCQDIETPSGGYWHGIMHRREPDYANAKYWFRRVGRHGIFPALNQATLQLVQEQPADGAAAFLTTQASWDPFAFVDLCESVEKGRSGAGNLCRNIQAREWELLFDFCFRQAVGT